MYLNIEFIGGKKESYYYNPETARIDVNIKTHNLLFERDGMTRGWNLGVIRRYWTSEEEPEDV